MMRTMRIWIFSDLHIGPDGRDFLPDHHPEHDAIVVAGDVMDGTDSRLEGWLMSRFSAEERARLVYVPGNHDFFGYSLDDGLARLRRIAEATGIHMLHNDTVEIGGVRFAGTPLWTNFQFWGTDARESAMNLARDSLWDFQRIPGYTPEEWLQRHAEALAFLEAAVTPVTVVVTHHAPHENGLRSEMLHSPRYSWAAPAYASDLTELAARLAPRLWIHGHTHVQREYDVAGVPVVSNALGRDLAINFEGGLVIDLLAPTTQAAPHRP
jgi:Icc-related predicted phosphoesterase